MAGEGVGSPGQPNAGLHVDYENGHHRATPPATDEAEHAARVKEEVPLDFSLRKRDSEEEDDDAEDSDGSRHGGYSSPPPLMKREQVPPCDFAAYKPGPTVFPHIKGGLSPPMPKTDNCVSPRQATKKEERIGEPQTASPGVGPGVTMPAAAQMGLLPGFPPAGFLPQSGLLSAALPLLQMDPRAANVAAQLAMKQQSSQSKNGSTARPFKTYPKDPLSLPLGVYNLPGLPAGISPADLAAAQAMSANSEELFSQYKHMVRQMQGDLSPGSRRPPQNKAVKERRSSDGSTSSQVSSTSAHSEQGSPSQSTAAASFNAPAALALQQPPVATPCPPAPQSPPEQLSPKNPLTSNGRKRPKSMPDELKDYAYWERRRKNNEAAKRSRDARRAKEDEIAIRAAFLEQENLKLRVEVAALKNETSKLRCMLYNS